MKENGRMNWLAQIRQMKNRDIRTIEQSELQELQQDAVEHGYWEAGAGKDTTTGLSLQKENERADAGLDGRGQHPSSLTMTESSFMMRIIAMTKIDITPCRYKVLGRVANSDQGLCMLFDLEEAIMFTPKPQEYADPLTGEMKKKQMKFFPDTYRNRIGKSYNDYIPFFYIGKMMVTPARTLNGLRSKTCSGNWSRGPSTVFW